MKIENTYYALLRLGKNKNVLYNECIRAKDIAFTRSELIKSFTEILEKNKKTSKEKVAYKLINCILKKGRVDENKL